MTTTEKESRDDRMRTQSAEFDAACNLSTAYRNLPAVVDDDYPRGRHYYESAVRAFLLACRANGRTV